MRWGNCFSFKQWLQECLHAFPKQLTPSILGTEPSLAGEGHGKDVDKDDLGTCYLCQVLIARGMIEHLNKCHVPWKHPCH